MKKRIAVISIVLVLLIAASVVLFTACPDPTPKRITMKTYFVPNGTDNWQECDYVTCHIDYLHERREDRVVISKVKIEYKNRNLEPVISYTFEQCHGEMLVCERENEFLLSTQEKKISPYRRGIETDKYWDRMESVFSEEESVVTEEALVALENVISKGKFDDSQMCLIFIATEEEEITGKLAWFMIDTIEGRWFFECGSAL